MAREMEPTPEQFREMALEAIEIIEAYLAGLPNMAVMPATTSGEVRDLLFEPLPEQPTEFLDALATVRDVVYPLSRHNGHPRFFGYVSSPGTPVSAIGDFLAAALNANVTSWRSAPAATAMEQLVIDWLKASIGYDADAAGLLVSGGSMANLTALAIARTAAQHLLPCVPSRSEDGFRVYASTEAHFSVSKAARLLGIDLKNLQYIPTDTDFRINVAELEQRISADFCAGLKPMCIVANAGTVNTGAVDPIGELATIAERYGLWLHVDGAYGGLAALAPSAKVLFAGIERANSVSLDPHKWLYSSVGCGCILYRDPKMAILTFAEHAEYTRPFGLPADESFAFWDFGPELSRPFRALPVWLQFKVYGVRAISAAIERNLACARHFETLIQSSPDFELLAPVELSVFCFRFRPTSYTADLDTLNETILIRLQQSGSSYLSNARVHGKFALRGCVLNYRTTIEHMDRLFKDTQEAARFALATEAARKSDNRS